MGSCNIRAAAQLLRKLNCNVSLSGLECRNCLKNIYYYHIDASALYCTAGLLSGGKLDTTGGLASSER